LILAAFPSYRKRTAYIAPFGASQSINSYWDGGSKAEYAIVEIATLRESPLPSSTHPAYEIANRGLANTQDEYVTIDRAGNVRLKSIPAGFVLITAGTSCGKPATAILHFGADDLALALGAGASTEARQLPSGATS